MKILSWLIVPPLMIVAAALAVANRGAVVVSFDPLPVELERPLYEVMLGAVFLGLVIGSGAIWWRDGRVRQMARRRRREIQRLERELKLVREAAGEDVAAEPETPVQISGPGGRAD